MYLHHSLGSSSKGNCHLISCDGGVTYIMLDAGIKKKRFMDSLYTLGVKLHQIEACLITHEHNDHSHLASYLVDYMDVYASKGTKDVLGIDEIKVFNKGVNKINDFKVVAFAVNHDAEDPVNFIIQNISNEFMLYITDTGSIDVSLKGIKPRYILIEANHDEDLLEQLKETSEIAKIQWERNMELDNRHLSIQKTIKILDTIDLTRTTHITLCHVSEMHGSEDFKGMVKDKIKGAKINQLKANEIKTIDIIFETPY